MDKMCMESVDVADQNIDFQTVLQRRLMKMATLRSLSILRF